ncbi:MAG: hypothetical protein M1450_03165 [Patescibacteria group bacterium]|nr:hypothetical protein [Patescibacteria group bacterium]
MKKNKRLTVLYFANGGYLMKAFFNQQNNRNRDKEITLSAKRIWSEKFGYGVLIKGSL